MTHQYLTLKKMIAIENPLKRLLGVNRLRHPIMKEPSVMLGIIFLDGQKRKRDYLIGFGCSSTRGFGAIMIKNGMKAIAGRLNDMGIYYAAVDWDAKELIEVPEPFSCKNPGIYHPRNPFSNIVIMKNLRGSNFVIENDTKSVCYYDHDDLKDITEEVYKEFLETYPWAKEYYELELPVAFTAKWGLE